MAKRFAYTFPAGSWRGSEPTVQAFRIIPGLVITKNGHKRYSWYRITHEQSGLNCARDFDRMWEAVATAEALGYLLDWDRPIREIEQDMASSTEFRDRLRKVALGRRH